MEQTVTTTETTTIEYDGEGHVAKQVVVTVVEASDAERGAADELIRETEALGLYEDRRLAVDADGFVWWVNADGSWSMARSNPDNSPIPQPVTYYGPVPS